MPPDHKSDEVKAYNTRLIKGGALLEDMRLLVRSWENSRAKDQINKGIFENLLGKNTRSRSRDIFTHVFLPRFVNGNPENAWKILKELEDRNIPIETLRPVYYWITARNEFVLYDFVTHELIERSKNQDKRITTNDVIDWLKNQLILQKKQWSNEVIKRVARGILSTLRDFGILEGSSIKKIAPIYIPVESFAYISFAISRDGVTGANLLNHPDWNLFLFSIYLVEHMFLEADRYGLLRYQAAGNIVRIDFKAKNFTEMADVIATRAH